MAISTDPKQNRLLAALPDAEWRRWLPQVEPGHIKVLDRVGLEKRSCECYEVLKNEYDRLLPKQFAA